MYAYLLAYARTSTHSVNTFQIHAAHMNMCLSDYHCNINLCVQSVNVDYVIDVLVQADGVPYPGIPGVVFRAISTIHSHSVFHPAIIF